MTTVGKVVASSDDYSVYELFTVDEDGKYHPIGFGVFNNAGEFVGFCFTIDEAQELMAELSAPPTKTPRP
jgi:hypothetical protein